MPVYYSQDELASAIEILPEKLYFASVRRPDVVHGFAQAHNHTCFSIDHDLLYQPFFADFGPLNLGLSYRFCQKLRAALKAVEGTNRRVYYYCGPEPNFRANACVLMGIYLVLYEGWSSDQAYRPLQAMKPFKPFRDASCGTCTFNLTPLDCLRAVEKARDVGLIDFHVPGSAWDPEEYEFYEQVENGDMNWIVPGKFLAFSGPAATRAEYYGYRSPVPEDYIEYFKAHNIQAVVRLNKKVYDRRRFMDAGIRHYELYFPDGSCPTDQILKSFLEITESEPGAVAVHCKAGLGRTGVLIGCYLMKHYGFTAADAIAYIRICRPGSVIGPQQNFLQDTQARLWRGGDLNRTGATVPLRSGSLAGSGDAQAGQSPLTEKTSPMKPMRSGTVPSQYAGMAAGRVATGPAGGGVRLTASVAAVSPSGMLNSRGNSRPGSNQFGGLASRIGAGASSAYGPGSVYASAPVLAMGSRGSQRDAINAVTLHTDTVAAAANRALLEGAPPRQPFASTMQPMAPQSVSASYSGSAGGASPFIRPAMHSGYTGGFSNGGSGMYTPHPPAGAPPGSSNSGSPQWGRSGIAVGSGASAARTRASPASPAERPMGSPVRSRPQSSTRDTGAVGTASGTSIPVAASPPTPSGARSGSPVIQRIVNAAGQPRKIAVAPLGANGAVANGVPANNVSITGRSVPVAMRAGSPGRPANNGISFNYASIYSRPSAILNGRR